MVRTWLMAMIGLGSVCAPGLVQARALQEFTAGPWKVVAYSDDKTGAFAYCGGLLQSRAGTGLMFSVDPDQHWSVGFSGPLGRLEVGSTYDVRYQIDRGQPHQAQARAVQANLLQVALPQAGDMQEFRLGSEVRAQVGDNRVNFPLRNMQQVFTELTTCLQKGKTLAAAAAPSGTGSTGEAAEQSPDAERKLEAVTLAANLLSRAGVGGFEMQPAADVPQRFSGQEVNWRAGTIAGAIRIQQDDGNTTPEKVRSNLVSGDVQACNAHFAAEAVPGSDKFGTSLYTQCDGDKGWSASYMTLARPQGGFYVLSLLGQPDKADGLRKAATALQNAAPAVLQGKPATAQASADTADTKRQP